MDLVKAQGSIQSGLVLILVLNYHGMIIKQQELFLMQLQVIDNIMRKNNFILILVIILGGCSHEKITITNEYIINPNWNEQANAIKINKMKVKKDSTINPASALAQKDILNKLEEDSSFRWYANVKTPSGNSYKTKKIYFNKDNGFFG